MQTTARREKHALKLLLAIAVFLGAISTGCGRNGIASFPSAGENSFATAAEPPEIASKQQTEQKLDPLTKEDVELYLRVMRAAAERVKSRAPTDTALLDTAKKILASDAAGRVPSRDDVMTLERANLVALSMDQIIAEGMKLDGRTYRGIAEAVEAVVPNPALGGFAGDAGASAVDHTLTPLEARLRDINTTNKQFLARYRDEIQKLIAVVHNPANLPK